MTVHNFAWVMCKKLGIGEHEVKVTKDNEFVFEGTFYGLLIAKGSIGISESEILGVSMMLSTTRGDKPEYATMISI